MRLAREVASRLGNEGVVFTKVDRRSGLSPYFFGRSDIFAPDFLNIQITDAAFIIQSWMLQCSQFKLQTKPSDRLQPIPDRHHGGLVFLVMETCWKVNHGERMDSDVISAEFAFSDDRR